MANEHLVKMQPRQLQDYIYILKEQGKPLHQIKTELLEEGVSEDQFNAAMALPAPALPTNAKQGMGTLVKGLLWFGGGAVLTLVSYNGASSSGGGTYLIATGPMIYGAILIVEGLVTGSKS